MQLGQLPDYLKHAISAVASRYFDPLRRPKERIISDKRRYTPHPGGYQSAVSLSEDYAARSRREIDVDEPSLDSLQAALLLVIAFVGSGRGKKAYMMLSE